MKGLSIRFKITCWFTVALMLVAFLAYVTVFFVNHQIIQKTIRDNLVETVEHNVDEIEYYDSLDSIDLYHETDFFCIYGEGYLEIDDDFLDQVNEVYTALYHTDNLFLPLSGNRKAAVWGKSHFQGNGGAGLCGRRRAAAEGEGDGLLCL